MKKVLFLLLSTLILVLICSNYKNEKTEVDTARAYVYQESIEVIKPTIVFQKSAQFQFTYSALSSYLPRGSYEFNDGYLYLKTDDGKYEYVFQREDNALIFNAEKSSPIPSFANVPDGAVFE